VAKTVLQKLSFLHYTLFLEDRVPASVLHHSSIIFLFPLLDHCFELPRSATNSKRPCCSFPCVIWSCRRSVF